MSAEHTDGSARELVEAGQALDFVKSSRYRRLVLKCLHSSDGHSPTGIADRMSLDASSVRRALGELRDRDVVEKIGDASGELNDLYRLTDLGDRIAPHLDEVVPHA